MQLHQRATGHGVHRGLAGLAGLTLTILAAVMLALAPPVDAGHVEGERVAGEDRFETAAEVARANFPIDGTHTALLASGRDFPDALAANFGSGEAAGLRAPVLLTEPDHVPEATLAVLEELDVQDVVIIGGPGAVSFEAGTQLVERGYEVDRIHGDDRYATAAAVASEFGPIGEVDGQRVAMLASGEVFPDALSAGPISAGEGFPLLLSQREAMPPATTGALAELDIDRVLIVGGTAVVSQQVQDELEAAGYDTERLAGINRQGTATHVADYAVANLGWTLHQVLLATDLDFPDALAAGSYGGRLGFPIVLADVPPAAITEGWLQERCPHIEVVRAIGGEAAISAEWHEHKRAAADSCEH